MFAVQSGGGAKEEETPRTFLITSHAAKLEQPRFCDGGCPPSPSRDQLRWQRIANTSWCIANKTGAEQRER